MRSKAQTPGRWGRPWGVVLACALDVVFAVVSGSPAETASAAAADVTLVATLNASGAVAGIAPLRAADVSVLAAATAPISADSPTSAAPAAAQELDRLMGLLAQRQHGHVTFVEEHFLAVLDRPTESSGELLYDAPDRLEKRTLKPKPETVVLEHGVITAHRGHRTYVLNLSDYPQIVPLIDSIRATLAGDRASLERIFKVTLEGSLDHWTLLLLPSDASVAKSVKQIRIEGTQDAIHTVEIQQADGDRSLLTIGPEVAQ